MSSPIFFRRIFPNPIYISWPIPNCRMTNHLESPCWMVQFFNPRGSGWVNQPKISERQPLGTACLFHLALVDLCCGHQIHGGTLRWSPSPPNLTRDRLVVQQRGGYAQNIAKHHAAGCFVERDSLLNDDNRGDIGQLEKNHQPTGFWRLHISENNSMQWWVVGVWS